MQALLHHEGVLDALLDHRHGFQQHTVLLGQGRNLDQVLRGLHVELSHETVLPLDAALGVPAAGAHVVFAVVAVGADTARPPHGGDDKVAGLKTGDIPANFLHHSKVLVPEDEVIVSLRGLAVEAVVDLLIRTAETHSDHPDGDLIRSQGRLGNVAHVNGFFLPRRYYYCFHGSIQPLA